MTSIDATGQFEQQRTHLLAVAYRILGSRAEAEDAVQETWLRLHRSDITAVDNLRGWLTTVTSRVCLDVLRARRQRPEQPTDVLPEPGGSRLPGAGPDGPEAAAETADAVGAALLVVLDTLGPDERLAFVLHDLFAVPFAEIATALDKTPEAARQLASRARRRVRGGTGSVLPDRARQQAVVDAFLAASKEGRFDDLVALLHPDAVLRADVAAVAVGAPPELIGADAVARRFSGGAKAARPALVDGLAGLVWEQRGRPRVVFCFDVVDGRVHRIDMVSDPGRLERAEVVRTVGRTEIWWADGG